MSMPCPQPEPTAVASAGCDVRAAFGELGGNHTKPCADFFGFSWDKDLQSLSRGF